MGWLAEIARQLLEAFRHCHELRPHSLVHGDLRLTSLLISAMTDAKCAPQLVLADLGLAGLPPAPPPLKPDKVTSQAEDWSQCPCPLLDVWSCGCLIFMLLSGRHPFNGDPGGRLVPSALSMASAPPEPDWRMLPSASSASLCAQMLSWELKARPSAADCLRHSWLSADDSHDVPLPMEALGNLLHLGSEDVFQSLFYGTILLLIYHNIFRVAESRPLQKVPNPTARSCSLREGNACALLCWPFKEVAPQVEAAGDHRRSCHL